MERLDIDGIKAHSFQVLCKLRDVCQDHGLSYSLTGGTLIGAVRHQGFIPWDDDIDVMMPRPDYDRLIALARQEDLGFDLFSQESGEAYWYPFAKACCRGTVIRETATVESGLQLGVYVDIFPVDGVGKTYAGSKWRTMCFQFLHGLKVTSSWKSFQRSKLRKWYYEPARYLCYLLSRCIGRKRLDRAVDRFLRAKPYEKANFAGRLVGDYGSREIMPKAMFEKLIQVTFEGTTFAAIADYDTFLTRLYGDYMQLPPLEKQVTHHSFEAYRL